MATLKRQRVKLGKEIRRVTGLKLPVAMRAAKLILGYRSYEMNDSDLFKVRHNYCGDHCCKLGSELIGPRGVFNY